MINIDFEKSTALDAQERYEIISMAMDAADDNGFINSFVFERALYAYAAIIIYQDRKEELSELAVVNPINCWNTILNDGTLQEMQEKYEKELAVLVDEAMIWYDEYSDYAHSARGILEIVQQFTGNIVEGAASRLTQTAEETGVQEVLQIADEWGFNRNVLKPEPVKENIIEEESLFNA